MLDMHKKFNYKTLNFPEKIIQYSQIQLLNIPILRKFNYKTFELFGCFIIEFDNHCQLKLFEKWQSWIRGTLIIFVNY